MKKIIFFILFFLIGSITYSQSKIPKDTSAKEVVIKFFKWYFNFENNANKTQDTVIDPIVNGEESGLPYRVNFKSARKYLEKLKKCDMLSNYYLKELQKYFVRCDSNFVKHPQRFHVPHGLDFDLVMKSNDYDNIENNIDNSVISFYKRKGNKVYMKLDFIIKYSISNRVESYHFQLSKHKGKWLIDKINGDFPTEIDHKEISWPK